MARVDDGSMAGGSSSACRRNAGNNASGHRHNNAGRQEGQHRVRGHGRASSGERRGRRSDPARHELATVRSGLKDRRIRSGASGTGVLANIGDAQSDAMLAASTLAICESGHAGWPRPSSTESQYMPSRAALSPQWAGGAAQRRAYLSRAASQELPEAASPMGNPR